MSKNLISTCIVFSLLLGSLSINNTFAISLGAALDEMMTKIEADGTLSTVPGKSSVSSLYDKAMKTVKKQTYQPSADALSQTVKYFRTYKIANASNTLPACNGISQEDISVVLYSINTTFRNALKDLFEQEGKELVIPITKDYNKATVCKEISACIGTGFSTASNSAYIQDVQDCEEVVSNIFQRASNASSFFASLSNNTYGTEFFQNGTLDDSDFDLLVDIAEIGRIMFEWYKPPLTTVFYGMPSVGSLFGGLWGLGGWWLADFPIDSTQSYTTSTGLFTINMWASSPSNNPGISSETLSPLGISFADVYEDYFNPSDPNPTVGSSSTDDATLDIIIDQINGATDWSSSSEALWSSSVSLDFLGNNTCIAPYTLSGVSTTGGIISMWWVALWSPDIADILATPVPSDVYDAISEDYYTAISPNLLIDTVWALIPLALSGVDNPTQQQVEMAINTAVDQAFDLSSGPDDEDVQSCLSECSSLPFLDMLVCQSACLCSKFESPALGNDATDKAGVSIPKWAFAVRFCRVAPVAAQMKKNKRVYSIEEIFTEIRNIFTTMRQSGQLFKTVKTKEFLDSWMKKNKFGDLFAFSIRVGTKPSYDNTPASVAKNVLGSNNDAKQKQLLRKWGDPTSSAEKNKYVVTADIAYQKALAQWATDTTALQKLIDKERAVLALHSGAVNSQMFAFMSRDTLLNASAINAEVASFLDNNLQFWIFAYEKLLDINSLAGGLKKKIEKGK